MSKPVVNIWGTRPGSERAAVQPAPWDTKWDLRTAATSGTAWVFYQSPGENVLNRPVILADGFAPEGTDVDVLYDGLENGDYPLVSRLRQAGFDVIVLGFADRTASVLDNAEVAIQCIRRTIAEREGDAPLTVGGFSMGGLVTRYALAKMERGMEQHETATYLSYDTPHCGAWLPLGVQAFAHFVKARWGGEGKHLYNLYSDLVNSPAAREMLRWHLATGTDTTLDVAAGQDKARTDFLEALERVGEWPQRPRLLGVANGTGTGVGNHIPADSPAMEASGSKVAAQLRTQGGGRRTVAEMQEPGQDKVSVHTTGFPELDGAPGGLFPELSGVSNFGAAAALSMVLNGAAPEVAYNASTFVPTISAVAAADIDKQDNLYSKIDPEESRLHDFHCATSNEGHTLVTEELGEWIVHKLQDA
ncbi:esterase/lipase family protein [Streptomyces pratensis]|uniref:esterase/lipase family protein n=1 Tax=Streptomyces pratensis TaxID=1169025 RepID=UPI00363EAB01